MKKISIISLLFFIVLFLGCGPRYILKSDPDVLKINKEEYSIEVLPAINAFDISIENKSQNDIEIVWDKTYYIEDNRTLGGFMFEGIVYKDRANPKPPDIIFPATRFFKRLYPNNLVYFYQGWYNKYIPEGNNGIYLTMNIKGKEVREKLMLKIIHQY